MQKVFLTERIHPDAVAYLQKNFRVVQATSTAPDDIIRQAADCSGILVRSAKITAEIMDALPQLRVIAKHGMGVDNIDVEYAAQKGIQVVNAPYSNLNAVAEHICMLILSVSKRTVLMDRLTRQGEFQKRTAFNTTELKGTTLGIIGMGKISALVARKMAGFEMRMIAYDPFVGQDSVGDLPVTMCETADEVYRTSDFLVVHTSLFPSTYHLVGEEEFRQMKPTAFFFNAARGAVVDEKALIWALENGEIAGAGLDVFENEPPEDGNPLLKMEQVTVSPHNAALSDGALRAMAMDSALGVTECLIGQPITYPVMPKK